MPVLGLRRHHGGKFIDPCLREGLDAVEAGSLLSIGTDRPNTTHANIRPGRRLVLVRDAGDEEGALQLGRERSGTRGDECPPRTEVYLDARTRNIPVRKKRDDDATAAYTLDESGKDRLTLRDADDLHAETLAQRHKTLEKCRRLNLLGDSHDAATVCAHPCAGTIPAAGVTESEHDRAVFAGRGQGLESLEGHALEQRCAAARSKHQLLGVVADVRANCVAQLVGRRLRSSQTRHVGAQ